MEEDLAGWVLAVERDAHRDLHAVGRDVRGRARGEGGAAYLARRDPLGVAGLAIHFASDSRRLRREEATTVERGGRRLRTLAHLSGGHVEGCGEAMDNRWARGQDRGWDRGQVTEGHAM